VRPCGQYLTES